MKNFKGGGLLYNISPALLGSILQREFGDVKAKPRIFGYDFEYLVEHLEMFINTIDEKEYFIHINLQGKEEDIVSVLKKLGSLLSKENLEFELGYYEINENGVQITPDLNMTCFD